MAIITISRGAYIRGTEVAVRVAERLGYRCIAREAIIEEACEEFNVPEIRLRHAIQDTPSFLDRLTRGREKYITSFQAAFLNHMLTDNVVYHGLAGHFFLEGAVRVLKVRIIADMEDRVRTLMEREGRSREEALRTLTNDDAERRKWSLSLHGIDNSDPSLYDLVIHIKDEVTVEHAAGIICTAAGFEGFQRDAGSQRAIENLALAATVKAAVLDVKADVAVTADNGVVRVNVKVPVGEEEDIIRELSEIAQSIAGVKRVDIKVAHRVKWSDGRFFP